MKIKSFLFIICFPLLNILGPDKLSAQELPVDSLLIKALQTDILLPYLIDSAIKYAPSVNALINTESITRDNLKINKRNIFNSLSLLSSYYYGSNITAITSPTANPGQVNTFTGAQSAYYNLGIGMQFPIMQLINRKTTINIDRSLIKVATAQKEGAAMAVKLQVIVAYQDFKLSQKLVGISGKIKDFAAINYNMAEKDFIQGQGTMEQIARIQDIHNKAIAEYETLTNRLQTSLMQLEVITNTNILSLLNKVK